MPAFAAGCVGEAMNATLKEKMTHTTLNSRRASEFPSSGGRKEAAHGHRIEMEAPRRARRARERARHQHRANARNEPRRSDHERARGSREALGRDGGHPSQGEDRRAPPP